MGVYLSSLKDLLPTALYKSVVKRPPPEHGCTLPEAVELQSAPFSPSGGVLLSLPYESMKTSFPDQVPASVGAGGR